MKIKLIYKPHEEQEAADDLAALLQLHPDARVHKSDKHPPLKSIYVSTKKPGNPTDARVLP